MQKSVTSVARATGFFACVASVMIAISCGGAAAGGPDPATVDPAGQPSGNGGNGTGAPTDGPSAKAVNVADFSLETVDGKTVSLSEYAGKNVVMLDFWATWCEPCLAAMPHLNEIYKNHKDEGFMLLSISMDGPETVAEVRSYAQRHNLAFPVLLDQESRAVSLYNPKRSAPYSVLIARDGTILHKRDGYQPGDEVAIEEEIAEALENGAE